MDIRERLGTNVRRFRLEKGWTQDDLAEVTGLDRTYISGIERGRRNPSLLVIQRIALALGIAESKLLCTSNQEERVDDN
jgi:transcriptional regulator with XRE-family HTH domain